MYAIETINLSKKFKAKQVLDNINLLVKENEFFGFLGRNGAGKSTFINILTGSIIQTSGTFKLLNDDKISNCKRQIGVMPDVANLYRELNSYEFLHYMARLKKVKIDNHAIKQLLISVSLDVLPKTKIKDFSFGMRKKISLAQAIIGEPRLLFLDEPTSGVDPESIIEIQNLLISLNKKGCTIFLASHNLNEVEKLCTKVAILKDKGITRCGSLEDLQKDYDKKSNYKIITNVDENTNLNKNVLTKLVKRNMSVLHFEVKDKYEIAYIVKILTNDNIDIYSIEEQKVSLEEIFLS